MLGPVIEMIPQLLVIPVLLFVVGLLDNILSDILQLVVCPAPVVATISLSLFFIAGVVAFLGYTLFDGSARPHSSPFQSSLAGFLSGRIIPMVRPWISWPHAQVTGLSTFFLPLHTSHTNSTSSANSTSSRDSQITRPDKLVVKHYHETVQAIHDDDAFDKASAALGSVLGPQRYIYSWIPLEEEEVTTLVHLLSPEASIRANRTAAAAIAGLNIDGPNAIPQRVIIALVHAARRSVGSASIATLESSTFLAAMVQCIIQHNDPEPEHPPPIRILGSKYMLLEHEADSRPEVISLVCDIIRDFIEKSSGIDHQPHRMMVVKLFWPETISASIVLQALSSLDSLRQIPITHILIEAKTAGTVIQAALDVLKLLRTNSVQGLAMVGVVAGAVLSCGDFSDYELLCDLCVDCILNIVQDANYCLNLALMWPGHQVVEVLAKVPFIEENSTSDLRTAIEFSIETKGFTRPPPTQHTIMGQDMPMSELAQLLNRMAEARWLGEFDLDAAINDIRASRNS
ncbi:hypothetical protein C8J57DRAFT_1567298 [Mycena rebaudengoi]|nr:hypothetical protein C8J57DRAFT_1567298 [Mycena rebaudengoi]